MGEDWEDVVPLALHEVGLRRGEDEAPEVSQEKSKLGLGVLHKRKYLKKAIRLDIDAKEK